MPPRTSSKSSGKASSPPKKQLPSRMTAGRTRQTRSQSVELGSKHQANRVRKRKTRATSIESAKSDSSAASSTGGRRKTKVRAATHAPDLSIVPEDVPESEEDMGIGYASVEDGENESSDGEVEELLPGKREEKADENNPEPEYDHSDLGSPGPSSQISSTTVLTTQSERFSKALDPEVVTELPALYEASSNILNLLVPRKISKESINKVVKELKTLGSKLAARLKDNEIIFDQTKENFDEASSGEEYIHADAVNLALVGNKQSDVPFRPGPIIHAANLASLLKGFLVDEEESQSSHKRLKTIAPMFPRLFMVNAQDPAYSEEEYLHNETFELGLSIRTMSIIAELLDEKDKDDFDPDEILAVYFFLPTEQDDPALSPLENALRYAKINPILRDIDYSAKEAELVRERVEYIRSHFRYSKEAAEADDLVDFEQLKETFPWSEFLLELIQWCRKRLLHITKVVDDHGGVDEMRDSIIRFKSGPVTAEIGDSEPPSPFIIKPPQRLQEEITKKPKADSLFNTETLKMLKRFKTMGSTPARDDTTVPTSTTRQPEAGPSRAQSKDQTNKLQAPTQLDEWEPMMGPEEDEPPRSTAEYLRAIQNLRQYKNKENRKPTAEENNIARKKTLLDRQDNAERVTWSDDDDEPRPTKRPRYRAEREPADEEEVSQDEEFQADTREVDVRRRIAAPPGRTLSPVPSSMPTRHAPKVPSRNRSASNEGRFEPRSGQMAPQVNFQDVDEDDSDAPAPTGTQIQAVARINTLRAKLANPQTQSRVPWSDHDHALLIEYIAQFGTKWSLIARQPGWDYVRPNFEVQCKDRARNIKTQLLKSGEVLPVNFEFVRLGSKEIKAVQCVYPDYEYMLG